MFTCTINPKVLIGSAVSPRSVIKLLSKEATPANGYLSSEIRLLMKIYVRLASLSENVI